VSHKCIPVSSTVFTPQPLAAAMVRASAGGRECLWLDPCVGDGAFVTEMSLLGVPRVRIRALDISAKPAERDALATTQRGVDFIDWASRHRASVDRIVMNPPYVALSRLHGAPLQRALQLELAVDKRLPLKANYWCAFILSGIQCLRPAGTMVAVLPAAWDFAKYAARVRDTVLHAFGEVWVVRCATPMFPTVKDGAVVVVARRRGEQPGVLRRVEVPDIDGATSALLDIAEQRAPMGTAVVRGLVLPAHASKFARLDELIDIRIGGVTGDAQYFLLTEQKRIALGLPRASVRPVLSRSMHLSSAIISKAKWQRLRDGGARVWLFRPAGVALKHPAVRRHLQNGQGGECNLSALKVSGRKPWHRTPLPKRVQGFLSGMSKRLPFLVLHDMEGLTATNTLYVVSFRNATRAVDRAALGIVLLTSRVRRELAQHARVYADGLLKLEPTELGRIRVPVVETRRGALAVFRHATALLLAGKEAEAEALADDWVEGRPKASMRGHCVGSAAP
jgi:adenine-specific DNA-methyltransferase